MAGRATILNVVWSAALFWARFGINSIVFIVMVRWIAPDEIGAYGAAFGLVQILMAVQISGLPEAVIQAQGKSHEYTHTAFWLSVALGAVLALLVYLSAPLIGWVAESERAESFARALAVIPLATGLGAIPEAVMRTRLQLGKLAARTTLTLTVGGVLAIVLAAEHWGGWALIVLTLINNVAASLLNLVLAPWRPALIFSRRLVGPIFSVSASIATRNVVKSILNPSTQLLVTAILGTTAGGLYLLAVRFETILSSLSLMPVQYAALPMFARVRDDIERRKRAFLDAISVMSAIACPVYLGAAATVTVLLPALLGPSGDQVVPVVQGLLFHAPVLVLTNLGTPALVSVGRAHDTLRFICLQAVLNIPVTIAAAQISTPAVSWAFGLLNFAVAPLLLRYLSTGLGVATTDVVNATLRPWFCALIMAAAVWLLADALEPGFPDWAVLSLQFLLGFALYPLLLLLISRRHVMLILALLQALRRRP